MFNLDCGLARGEGDSTCTSQSHHVPLPHQPFWEIIQLRKPTYHHRFLSSTPNFSSIKHRRRFSLFIYPTSLSLHQFPEHVFTTLSRRNSGRERTVFAVGEAAGLLQPPLPQRRRLVSGAGNNFYFVSSFFWSVFLKWSGQG